MDGIMGEAKTPAECEKSEDIWFQITITLDPKNYKRLWAYAGSVNSSVSSVARESVVNFIKDLKAFPSRKKAFPQANEGNPS